MKERKYHDWFGDGDTNKDVSDAIKTHGVPERVFYEKDAYMAALVYSDKVVVVGYDSNEYTHEFLMDDKDT